MSTDENKDTLIMEHFNQLQSVFSDLRLDKNGKGKFIVAGNLSFTCSHDGKTIKDDYDIEMLIPDDYPQRPPTVKETASRIPRDKDNHVYSSDGTLCLGAPLAVKRTFAQERNLLWFVRAQVVCFLFSHSFKGKYGIMPFGELTHGPEGILEYYKELFSVQDDWHVLGLLRILADDNYRGHTLCPCGGGKCLRNCHGDILFEVRNYQTPNEFMKEYIEIFDLLYKKNKEIDIREYIPKKALRSIMKRRRKAKKSR